MDFLRDWPVDHCGAAVLHGGSVSFEGDVDRLFGLASVTKPLVAYAVLIAVEEGVFELSTPLGPPGGDRHGSAGAYIGHRVCIDQAGASAAPTPRVFLRRF